MLSKLQRANREFEQRVEERTRELAARNRELEEAYQRIEELARTDPLTGLANRRGLVELAIVKCSGPCAQGSRSPS